MGADKKNLREICHSSNWGVLLCNDKTMKNGFFTFAAKLSVSGATSVARKLWIVLFQRGERDLVMKPSRVSVRIAFNFQMEIRSNNFISFLHLFSNLPFCKPGTGVRLADDLHTHLLCAP
ncbi:MAG TPA: hypothetical protein VJ654_15495 [Noviherbaspirillum sp.]|nr:hypothetical protein [Noviherbaspirillum sp.]